MDEALAAVVCVFIVAGLILMVLWVRENGRTARSKAEAEARKWEAVRDVTDK